MHTFGGTLSPSLMLELEVPNSKFDVAYNLIHHGPVIADDQTVPWKS